LHTLSSRFNNTQFTESQAEW